MTLSVNVINSMTRISDIVDENKLSCCVKRNPNPGTYLMEQMQGIALLVGIYSTCYFMEYDLACLTAIICIQITGINIYLTLRALEQQREDMLNVSMDSDFSETSEAETDDNMPPLIPLSEADHEDETEFKELSELIKNARDDDMPELVPYMRINELSLRQQEQGARLVRSMNYEQVMAYEKAVKRLVDETAERNALRAGLAEERDIIREVNKVISDEHYIFEYLKNYN